MLEALELVRIILIGQKKETHLPFSHSEQQVDKLNKRNKMPHPLQIPVFFVRSIGII